MENLKEKMRQKQDQLDDCESEMHVSLLFFFLKRVLNIGLKSLLQDLKEAVKRGSVKEKIMADKKKAKQVERLKDQLKKLELQETDREKTKLLRLVRLSELS